MVDRGMIPADRAGSEYESDNKPQIRRRDPADRSANTRALLASLIRERVVPSLKRSCAASEANRQTPEDQFAAAMKADLLHALTSDDRARLDALSTAMSRHDLPFATVYRDILTPVAEELGTMWCEDRLSFLQVTAATARIQAMVHDLSGLDRLRNPMRGGSYRVLLARVSREEHTLGLLIVGVCYSLAGWEVNGGPELQADDVLFDRLRSAHFGVLGLSVGSHSTLGELSRIISTARTASVNKRLKIGIGGPAVTQHPDIIAHSGADFIANDAMDAVGKAEALMH